MFKELKVEEIKSTSFWVVPDAGSFTLGVTTKSGAEYDILIVQTVDLEDYEEDMIPGRIYINKQLIALKSEEEASVLTILNHMLHNDLLGHKEGLAVFTVRRIINFFNSGEAEQLSRKLSGRSGTNRS